MLDAGLSPDRPLVILCENGIEHGVLMLAAQHVGVPVAPVSVAYALASTDHAKLRGIIELLTPGAIVVGREADFSRALAAIRAVHEAPIVWSVPAEMPLQAIVRVVPFSDCTCRRPSGLVVLRP